jgi:hypothetical protein
MAAYALCSKIKSKFNTHPQHMNLPTTAPQELLELIRSLEVTLHQPAVRNAKSRLDALLHNDFLEIGRSGRTYNKVEMLAHLELESLTTAVWSQDFHLTMPAFSVALLTYKSAHVNAQGELSHRALRSSLWQLAEAGWQLRFHQGTPIETFVQSDNLSAPLLQSHTH